MSNRPVRLKYLKPKMKIILCIFLLYITAVSVFGQSVELHGILGQSVKFPAAVKKGGFLMYGTLPIGAVDSGSFMRSRNERFNGRVQWDSSTGFFSLSGLREEDSGEYKVQNKDQNIITVFQLNVHAVSVFGQSVELNGILGKSIEFPAAVKKGGYLMYRGVAIGDSSLETPGNVKYRGRLHWDSSTGLFSLSGLKMEDIGEYKVHNTDQNIAVFQLNVYEDNVPVSKPRVSITHNEYPCTLLCAVERGTGVTLSWYREGEKKPYVTSPVQSAPHLYLTQTVESGTYTCEAKNSVNNETSDPLTTGAHCTGSRTWIIVACVIAVVAALIAVVCAVLCYYIIRGRQAVRTLRRVKKLLENVDLHAYDETVPPDAVRPFILVKKLVDNVDLHAYVPPDALRTLIQVKKILYNVDPFECDETVPRNAVRTFIQVKQLLDNVDPHVCGFKRKHRDYIISNSPSSDRMRFPIEHLGETRLALPPDDGRTLIQVKKLLNNVDLHAFGETRLELSPDAVRTVIHVKKLLDNLDLHAYAQYLFDHENSEASDGFRGCLGPEETKNLTSSHQTEVPLNQATREVGEP